MTVPFATSARSSVGLEWELMLADRETGDLVGRAPDFLPELEERTEHERFTVTGLWRYDAIESQFYEQVYGLRQNFRNLWSVEYQIAFQQGQRRESGFQFRVQLEVVKF